MPDVKNFGEVEPGTLYRAARCDSAGIDQLVSHYHIRTVVNLDKDDDVCDAIHRHGLHYYKFPSRGESRNESQMKQFLKLMADGRAGTAADVLPVYVHCDRGADRTGEAVAAYRIVFQGWKVEHAIAELPKYHYWQGFTAPKAFLRTLSPGDASVVQAVDPPLPARCGR
jgi:protein tyrosine/serine phosphatase